MSLPLIFTLLNNKCLSNHILLIFKLYVYKFREKKLLNINNLIAKIQKIKRIEKEIALTKFKENNFCYKEVAHNR